MGFSGWCGSRRRAGRVPPPPTPPSMIASLLGWKPDRTEGRDPSISRNSSRPDRVGVRSGRAPVPGRPTPRQEAPPPGALVPPPQRAKLARKSARCGVGDRSPCPHPRTHSQWVVGPGRTPERTSGRGWESARPRTPQIQAGGAPPGHPHAAPTARKSARCGVGDGSPRSNPPYPQPVGSGPRPHARTDERSGVGERPSPDAPHPGKRRPPRAPSCRPHSAQSHLARARAVGLLTGLHARTPRTHSQWVVGPGRTPKRTRGRGWESTRPRTPHTQARGAPPGHPHAAPTARKASSQERALWGWRQVPMPAPPHPQPVGSGPRPHARADERSGQGERPSPDTPHPGKRCPPPRAPSCRPHSAQSQLARARAVGLVTGPHARIPRTHSQWVVGPGRTPERTSGRGWESARPLTPHTQAGGALPGHAHAAPTARKATSQECALWGS